MSQRKMPAFLIARAILSNRKVRRLTDSEFRCFIAILCVAAETEQGGRLLITEGEPATPSDFADAAGGGVTEKIARTTVRKLTRFGTIVVDADGVMSLKNFMIHNPGPRPSETPAAWADRKRRSRRKQAEVSKPYTPDAEAVALRDEHFPGVPITNVEGAVFTLRGEGPSRGEVTPETVGALLRDADVPLKGYAFAAKHFPGVDPQLVLDAGDKLATKGEKLSPGAIAAILAGEPVPELKGEQLDLEQTRLRRVS